MKNEQNIGIEFNKRDCKPGMAATWPYSKYGFCIIHFKDLYTSIESLKKHFGKIKAYGVIDLQASYLYKNKKKHPSAAFAILYDFVGKFIISNWQDLQEEIDPLLAIRLGNDKYVPIFLEVSNNLTYDDMDELLAYSQISSINGLIVSNKRLLTYITKHQKGSLKVIFRNPSSVEEAKQVIEMGADKICIYQKNLLRRLYAYSTLRKFLPAISSISDDE